MKRFWASVLAGVGLFCTLSIGGTAAFAQQAVYFTPESTIDELHEDATLQAAGIMTYSKDKNIIERNKWKGKTLTEYYGESMVQECVDSLNKIVDNYNSGVQITYKIYSQEEIAQDASKNNAELYYFPADAEYGKTKYAVVLAGNIVDRTAEIKEGTVTAAELNKKGYTAFVLRYRSWMEMDDDAPMQDMARAIRYITEHAEQFNVDTEDYAIVGYSSGGHIAGLFCGSTFGYKNYNLPKPGALILAYPINNFVEAIPVYHAIIDTGRLPPAYYDYTISGEVTDDYPPTFFWNSRKDLPLTLLGYPLQTPALEKALIKHNVTYTWKLVETAAHGSGLATGTDAEGWLDEAVAFWEEQTK